MSLWEQRTGNGHRSQMVRAHQLHRLRAEQPLAMQLTSVQKHLREPCIVADRGCQTRAAHQQ